ncbi:hypothetical protein KR222_008619 [Zaprionus bogoriensis]|nr:hypothetical protein KR222_008619 [Zaprionus bogoriensis]
MAVILLALLLVLLVMVYRVSMAPFKVFKERGIVHEPPKPFIGNISLRVLLGITPFLQIVINKYNKFKGLRIYGFYNVREAFFVLRDPELIKRVGIQDFDHFTNHRQLIPEFAESMFSRSLIALKGDKWREMRNTLTPAFTGSKLKAMFELINECSTEGFRYIEAELIKSNSTDIDLEMKDYFERFANDVIASAAFGIKVNSFVDKKNKFYTTGQSVAKFSGLTMIKFLLYGIMPRLMKVILILHIFFCIWYTYFIPQTLRVQMLNEKSIEYFNCLIFDAIKYRAEHKIVRPDMIHLMMEAKRQFEQQQFDTIPEHGTTEHAEFKDEDLLAQCLLFFFVGFETMSVCLCYLTYELCMNPEVQAQLYEEVASVEQELQGKPLNYNMLAKMKYMDMVISELLRLWPPAFSLDRQCNKDITMLDENQEHIVKFKQGDIVVIPIIAIHRDPDNYSDPELFKPERFLDENKKQIKPFTYLPFGLGPRSCIGNRMAIMEVKSIIYHLVSKFKLVPGEKTVRNMMNSLKGFHMQPKEKFWIKLVRRDNL